MDQIQPEKTFEESIKEVMQTLPPVIRTYLAEGKYTPVARSLTTKYGLRIDQAGVLEREIMLLLMGVENPDEFTQSLIDEARLTKQVVDGIVQDVNEQIFIPLRKEEMENAATVKPSATEVPQERGKIYAPPLQSPRYFHLENKTAQPSRPMPQSRPQPIQPLRPAAATPKPIESEKLLEDHEEPHIEFSKAPIMPVPTRAALPPSNLPGAPRPPEALGGGGIMPRIIPAGGRQEITAPKAETPVQPRVVAPVIPTKPYTIDPYREPIDEKS